MKPLKLLPAVTVTLLVWSVSAYNQAQADEFDDLFNEDAFSDVEVEIPASSEASNFSITHEVGSRLIANINSNEANAIEQRYSSTSSAQGYYQPKLSYVANDWFTVQADLKLSTDAIFWLRSEENWSDEDIENRQYSLAVNELIATGRSGNWQYSSGIQTVTFGLADALSIANNLYAQDMSIPGVTEIDDALIPAWTSMATGSIGHVRLKTGVIHQHKMNVAGIAGTDFVTPISAMNIQEEKLAVENMSAFVSVSGVAGALDWQLNANTQLEHVPAIEMQASPGGLQPVGTEFARTQSANVAASYVLGSILLKAEAGITQGLVAQAKHESMSSAPGTMVDYSKLKSVVGFDYNNSSLGRVFAELQYNTILDYDSLNLMQAEQQSAQWMILVSKTFLRETLTVKGQFIGFDISGDAGRIQGLGIEYDVNDQVSTGLQYIDYVEGEFVLLNGADDRDRLVFTVNYQF
ncbi:hypothetical protein [Reinekea sp.]|jgi:hypothetical protein|uniref:hypothetical protein n=1 Tax=Reinekea sp. TaxID=1970455 RepID=UPI003989289D